MSGQDQITEEKAIIDGVTYLPVEGSKCSGCEFGPADDANCAKVACCSISRKDNKSVVWRKQKPEEIRMKLEDLNKGDLVEITDGSYAVRVDKFEGRSYIGSYRDDFEVIYIRPNHLHSPLGTPIHDIFIQNTSNKRIYLHSAAFVRFVEPAVDPGLIKALKKSIQQWQIMYNNPDKTKEEVYTFLGGKCGYSCFLCDALRADIDSREGCKKCINWGGKYCDSLGTSFNQWTVAKTQKNALVVLARLEAELVRLEYLSKGFNND